MIEFLENRTLFSAVSVAEAALLAEAKTVKGDLAPIVAAARADVSALTKDLKALPKSAAVTSLKNDVASATKILTGEARKLIAIESGKLKQIVAEATAVNRHPTNVTDQTKLKSALNSAITAGTAPLAAIEASATAAAKALAADFSAVITANPSDTKLATGFAAGSALAAASVVTLTTDAGTLQSDFATFINSLA
jgi:hypothetical protein